MTKNKDILKPFEVIERQTLEVENVVEKNKYFTILFFSQLYTQLDTCQNFHPCKQLFLHRKSLARGQLLKIVYVCVAPPIEYTWCQFKMTSFKCPYLSNPK